jgi:hypothetical protein
MSASCLRHRVNYDDAEYLGGGVVYHAKNHSEMERERLRGLDASGIGMGVRMRLRMNLMRGYMQNPPAHSVVWICTSSSNEIAAVRSDQAFFLALESAGLQPSRIDRAIRLLVGQV